VIVNDAEAIHVVTRSGMRSVLLWKLRPGREYAIEVGKDVTLRVTRLGEGSFEVGGARLFFAQSGSALRLYDAESGKVEDVSTGEIGGHFTDVLYRRGSPVPIAAHAWLEIRENSKSPPEAGGIISFELDDVYLALRAGGRTVVTKAGHAYDELRGLGLRYETGGERGWLSPVYYANKSGKAYEVVCLTCLRDFEWAVAFQRIAWYPTGTVNYDADVITPNGLLAYAGVKAVDVPGFGRLDLGEVLAAAKGSKVRLHV